MSEQALDLRKILHTVWRRRRLMAVFAAVGLILGATYTAVAPPRPAAAALVVLPSNIKDLQTQVVIASSDPVLRGVQQTQDRNLSADALRKKLTVKSVTSNVISITATDATAGGAENLANSVAQNYIDLVTSSASPGGRLQAGLLQSASTATQTPLVIQLLQTEAIGILAGLLAGAIVALAISRGDRRLRDRDEIADSIGVPVLASLPVQHPADAAGWARLLETYQPSVVHAWRLRIFLRELGLAEPGPAGPGDRETLTISLLSLGSDPRALALGPQLAVFAASLGISTVLLVAPQDDAPASTALRAACAAPEAAAGTPGLRVAVAGEADGDEVPALVITVAVLDAAQPRVADSKPAGATIIGVTAGEVTAASLARVAVSAADAGRQVTGLLVADPLAGDRSTGRLPRLARPAGRARPTRLTGTETGAGARR